MFIEITKRAIGLIERSSTVSKVMRRVVPRKMQEFIVADNGVKNCGRLGKPKLGQPRPWGTITGSNIQLCESFKQDEKVPSENWLPRDGKVINGICGTSGCVYCRLKK